MIAKRVMDLAIAATASIVTFPLVLLVALTVRLNMGSPVIFRQQRLGKDRTPFTLYKFRTMRDAKSPDGKPLGDGVRLTKLGIWLRKTSLDELPQLWNVIRGDISLVGPRPMPLHYGPFFKTSEELRFSVRPGITGWAQLHGRNHAPWNERFANDVWYARNCSFNLDCRILAKTVGAVVQGRGVVVDARSIMLDLDEERAYMRRSGEPT